MHWLWFVVLYVLFFSVKDIIRKYSLTKFDNLAVLSLEFVSTWLVFLVAAVVLRVPLELTTYSFVFLGLGVLHGLGTMGKVNAMNISLSQTLLISKYNILFPLVLAMIFLGEYQYFSPTTISGLLRIFALGMLPVVLFLLSQPKKNNFSFKSTGFVWFVSIVQFFFFHATLDFFIKMNIQPDQILQAALFQRMSAAVVVMSSALMTKAKFPLRKGLFGTSLLNGVLIAVAFFASISAISQAPLAVVKPIQKMATVVIITLVGLFFFGEKKKLSRRSIAGYVLSGVGAVLLVLAEIVHVLHD